MLRCEFLIQSNIFKNLTWEEKCNLCVCLVHPCLGACYSVTPEYSEVLQTFQVWGFSYQLLFGYWFFFLQGNKYFLTWFVWDMNGIGDWVRSKILPPLSLARHELMFFESCMLQLHCYHSLHYAVNWDDLASAVLNLTPYHSPRRSLRGVFPEHNNIGPAPSWQSAPWALAGKWDL